jgi:peptidoglycan/LPS O-acetylase OafA/YrhL
MGSPEMFSLDKSKNDTSATLNLLRIIAAEMVCWGHANNLGGLSNAYMADDGVLVFFLLSGFLIAYTLDQKSRDPSYGIVSFGIERFSRIYTAYLPALLLIGLISALLSYCDLTPSDSGPVNLKTFIANIFMLQNYPVISLPTFATSGHLSSVAVEFHIYFFVGGIFFAISGQNRMLATLVAIIFCVMPLRYFETIAGSDRNLFVLWLAGFAGYFACRSISDFRSLSTFASVSFVALVLLWISHRTPGDDYNLQQYPLLALAFVSLIVATQSIKLIPPALSRWIAWAADYSFSLFLIHMITIRSLFLIMPERGFFRVIVAFFLSNVAAMLFAWCFERHYRRVADILKQRAPALIGIGDTSVRVREFK